jgi:peptidyl-prolyl cis-trans isomerase D
MAAARWVIWVRNAALLGVIVAFIAFFGLPGGRAPLGVVADVDGDSIRRDVFEFYRDSLARQLPDLSRDDLDRQTLAFVVQRSILAQEAEALGLQVTDAEIREEILADPTFRGEDGRFDRELFELFVARNDLGSARVYTEELRRDLLLRKFQRAVTSPVRVSESMVRDSVKQALVNLRLRYARASAGDFRAGGDVGADEIAAFVEEQRERLAAVYQGRIEEFRSPEQVRARHMLFRGADGLERAQGALARVRAGEGFDAVALEVSDDEATRGEGGDLGSFPRGRMLPEFEEVAFALEPGQVSEPVETSHGQHLILVEEHTPAVERSLDEVAEQLAAEILAEERSRERARAAAEVAAARIRAGDGLQVAARAAGLELAETPRFSGIDPEVPGIGPAAGLRSAALALTPEQPDLAEIFEAGDSFYLIALAEREEPDAEELELQVARARERLESQTRAQLTGQWYSARRDELERTGRLQLYPLYAQP